MICSASRDPSANLRILYGNASRSFDLRDVPLTTVGNTPVVADVNGDGVKDLALIEASSGRTNIAVLLGNLDGSYQTEQFIYSNNALATLMAGRYDRDTKPDLMAWNALDGSHDNGYFEFLHNTTNGNFPTCAPPNSAMGIANLRSG